MSGNCFYDAENVWVPRKKIKLDLNFHKPAVDRIRELEKEVANLKEMFHEKLESKQKEIDRLNAEVKYLLLHEIVRLRREREALKRENEILKEKLSKMM